MSEHPQSTEDRPLDDLVHRQPSKEEALAAIQADAMQRAQACEREFAELLQKHNCGWQFQQLFHNGQQAEAKLVFLPLR